MDESSVVVEFKKIKVILSNFKNIFFKGWLIGISFINVKDKRIN